MAAPVPGPVRPSTGRELRPQVRRRERLAIVEGDKARGRWVDPNLGKTRFGQWADEVERTRLGRRESTITRDRNLLDSLILPTFGARTLQAVQPVDVQAWVAELDARGYAPATIRKASEILARAFARAVDAGMILRTPCRGINLPRASDQEMRSPPQLGAVAVP